MTGLLATQGTRDVHREPDSSLIDAARGIAPIIRAYSDEAERERRLSRPVLDALRTTGLLRMTTPRSLGGSETDPVTRAVVIEEIGRHDSAAAWTLENPLDWAFLCCRLPDEGAEEIYGRGADILIAGQFGRPLRATSTLGGYRVSGRAPFVSNCYDADWILSMVVVEGESAGGEPEMRMAYFPSKQCEIVDTWDVMGMRGTGSNDISVTDVFVPTYRTFPFVPAFEPGSHYRGPLYRLPVVGVAASGIPTPMLGVARRALDVVADLARTKSPVGSNGLLKDRPSAQVQLGRGEAILRSGRLLLLDTLDAAWQRCLDGRAHSLEQKAELLLGLAHAMGSAVQAVELACSIAGTTAFRATSPLERCFRDVQTMRHHVWASEQRYGTFGQVRLGVHADFPVVAF
ncbi:acyl-CoA dehydrogenase family protein [Geodermatophilus sp. YIM 151500]|uniref:acyl-CoA dehydrogenase family protein n=1 Tax=Geodermatophilus sp. YIM 151500 TaxID=2984531 RepID=UPI0021E48252|nr:acyl-CoA dehydrogenase family protein [Geodermatophilus sp. YIM 151500]MCV2490976.1 acyl-CoA dehydrogenase family protein [Geodermatophilus sp. YIM 151500]